MAPLLILLTSKQAQWIGFVLGGVIISLSTLTPIEHLPPAPGSDKLHHLIGFGGWALMCAFGPFRQFLIMATFIALWGGVIELIQPYVNRYGEWLDFFANSLGVLCTVTIKTLFHLRIARSISSS
ncbi:hypothetical protein OFY17_04915 [Marinomonas sp. C2222]|uniref:VanZ-like domain-containing protein n=1 Tax=Marinomonas sargassi TaxID=2984494 RepID=A0ABT2YQR7_9GAMM|nr:hypothetical protein [Marinomonas sargassi]MCV2402225.1 hypothetical protein [Marinomonas sargassi]